LIREARKCKSLAQGHSREHMESRLGGYTANAAEGGGSLFGTDPGWRQAFTIDDTHELHYAVADTEGRSW
jgi:hypothetical protein